MVSLSVSETSLLGTRLGPSPGGSRPSPVPAPRGYRLSTLTVAGCLGTLTVALGTAGLPVPMTVAVTLGLTGVGLVVEAWLLLGRQLHNLSNRLLYAIAASWCLPLVAARPLFSGDVWSYLAQGLIAATGRNPYELGPMQAFGADSLVTGHVSHYWVDTPAPYGPAWVALSRGVAQLAGENLVANVLAYRLIALVGVAMIAWVLPRLARRAGVAPPTALWLGLLNPLVSWHLVAGAHNDAIMLGLMLVGMELALSGSGCRRTVACLRVGAGLVMLTIASNVKVVAFVAVCCLTAELARRRGRPAVTVLVVALGCAAVTVAVSLGSGLGFGWIGALRFSGSLRSWLAPTNLLGFLVGGLGRLGGMRLTSAAIEVAVVVGAGICAVVMATLLWAVFRGRLHPLRGLGLGFAVVVACGPVLQPWYVLWAVLPLATTARTSRDRTVVAAVSAAVAIALPPFGHGVRLLVASYLAAGLLVAWVGYLVVGLPPAWRRVAVSRLRPRPHAGRPAPTSFDLSTSVTHYRMRGSLMISLRGLTKRYGDKLAVDNLTLTLPPGKVTGFLGPNGAGKSTTMRMILGLDAPTAGTALIGGRRYRELKYPLRTIGAVLDARAVHPARSGRNHLRAMARSQGIGFQRVEEVLALTGMTDAAHRRVGTYSLGMAQRLGIAGALLGDPQVLMLDEPVNGLDPDGVRWIRVLLRSLAADGRTVFVSSHLMSEMERTADRLVVLGQGRLLADEPLQRMTAGTGVRVRGPRLQPLAEVLPEASWSGPDELTVPGMTPEQVGEQAHQRGVMLHGLCPLESTLEDSYLNLTAESTEYGAQI